jgi:hypothetical protein
VADGLFCRAAWVEVVADRLRQLPRAASLAGVSKRAPPRNGAGGQAASSGADGVFGEPNHRRSPPEPSSEGLIGGRGGSDEGRHRGALMA